MNNAIVPIFAGGGTRLPAHLGVLKALELLVTDDYKRGLSLAEFLDSENKLGCVFQGIAID